MHLTSIIATGASLVLLVEAYSYTQAPHPTTTTSGSSVDTSTCARQSIAACPTAYDPCCAFICAEAQVPFDVCSPNNQTVLASCSQCTYPATTKASSTPKTTPSAPKTTPKPTAKTTTTSSSSSVNTATCARQSIAACPTAYDPCCAFICAEAQVPFDVCSPNNQTVLASCSQCTYPATTKTSSTPKTTPSAPKTTAKTTIKTAPKSTTKTTAKSTTAKSTTPPKTTLTKTASTGFPFPTSTCTGRLLSTAGCPTPYDHCCQYVCEEAQVPFDVCSLTNGSGEFAVCTSCPSPSPT